MGDGMSDDTVVKFPGSDALPDQTITIKKEPYSFCRHESITLDSHNRMANSAKCGTVIEPFNFLLNNAAVLSRAWQDHDEVKRRVGELLDRVEFLKKEKARLEGQVKRIKEKVPVINTRNREV